MNLQIRPAADWDEGARYIVALRRLRNASGDKILRAGAAFRLYRDRKETDNKLIESRRAHMNSIFRKLGKAGIGRKSLYLAWDFTVASERNLTERALHIRDDAFALLGDTNLADGIVQGNAPAFTVTSTTAVNDEPGVGMRIEGTFQVPCYLDSAGCEPGGGFSYASKRSNIPVRGDTANFRTAPFYCNVPSAASPANRALNVQYGHGLLGSGNQVFSESDIQRMAERHNGMYCATDWTGMNVAEHPVRRRGAEEPVAVPEVRGPAAARLRGPALPRQADAAPERPRIGSGVPAGGPADLRQLEAPVRLEQPGRDPGRRPDGARPRLPERRARRAGDQLLDPPAAQRRLRRLRGDHVRPVPERARAAARPRA